MKASGPAPMEVEDFPQWLHLFDRIGVTLISVSGAEAQRIFRALGPQRQAHAYQRLLLERQRLIAEMQDMGVCPLFWEEGAALASGLSCESALDIHYELLAQAFAQCAPIALRLERFALRHWLLARAHMHRQHALFLLT